MKNQENEYIEIRLEFVLLNSLVVAKLPGKGSRVQIPTISRNFFNQIIRFYFFITDVPFHVFLQKQLPKTLKMAKKRVKSNYLPGVRTHVTSRTQKLAFGDLERSRQL